MSTVVFSSSDEFMTIYLAKMAYPDDAQGGNFRVGETEVRLIPEGNSLMGVRALRIILFDDGQMRDLAAWKRELQKRLDPDRGRLIVVTVGEQIFAGVKSNGLSL